jgi:hypothetical protein
LKSTIKAIGLHRRDEMSLFDKSLEEVTIRGSDSLSKLFYQYSGDRVIHKWNHYLPIYSRLLTPFQDGFYGRPLRFLEIGVWRGGSMQLWRSFFGPRAVIFGIDKNPKCSAFNDDVAKVRIGSQDDVYFLSDVIGEMGGVDVVLDDGSHIARHQRASFEFLFPILSDNGLYVIEDTHTSYWRRFGGGIRRRGTIIEHAKGLVDDMHSWYHRQGTVPRHEIASIQFFDSIIAIEKKSAVRPSHTRVGPPVEGIFSPW